MALVPHFNRKARLNSIFHERTLPPINGTTNKGRKRTRSHKSAQYRYETLQYHPEPRSDIGKQQRDQVVSSRFQNLSGVGSVTYENTIQHHQDVLQEDAETLEAHWTDVLNIKDACIDHFDVRRATPEPLSDIWDDRFCTEDITQHGIALTPDDRLSAQGAYHSALLRRALE